MKILNEADQIVCEASAFSLQLSAFFYNPMTETLLKLRRQTGMFEPPIRPPSF
jgi:hypothetical protein